MRIGLFLRLFGLVLFIGLIAVEGTALKTRAFEGRTEHYTVVLKDGSDPAAVAADQKSKGVKLVHVVDGSTPAYVATMPADSAAKVRNDARVSYIVFDGHRDFNQSWWDTTKITLRHVAV